MPSQKQSYNLGMYASGERKDWWCYFQVKAFQEGSGSKPHRCRTTTLWIAWSWWLVLVIIIASSNHGGFPSGRGSCFCLRGCLVREQHAWGGGESKLHFNVIYGRSELVWHGQAIEGFACVALPEMIKPIRRFSSCFSKWDLRWNR